MYIIVTPKDPFEIESMIDQLYGEGPKATIARMLCRCPDPNSKDGIEAITQEVGKRHPQEFRILKRFILPLISQIQNDISSRSEKSEE